MKTTRLVSILAAVGLAASVAPFALAQPGPRGGHFGHRMGGDGEMGGGFARRARELAEYLDLTEEQRAASRSLIEELRATTEPLRDSLGPLHDSLQAALDDASPDAATVGGIMIDIDSVRDQMRAAVDASQEQFVALLTPEQAEKYEAWKELRGPRRGPRGPRGPHGQHGGDDLG